MDKGSDSLEASGDYALAVGFDKVVNAEFPTGDIPVGSVASAMSILFSTYCLGLCPSDRILILNEFVEAVIKTIHENQISDLLLN